MFVLGCLFDLKPIFHVIQKLFSKLSCIKINVISYKISRIILS